MIRIALIAIGFLAVTITLIIMQPGAPRVQTAQTPAAEPVPVTRADTDFDTLSDVTATIAAEPEEANAEPQPAATDATQPTLAATQTPTPAPTPAASGLENLIIEALRQGQSEAYIDALVNDAADKGRVEVPGSLVTADGRVDTATLLTVLSNAPDAIRAGAQIYTVQPGDSLASIAYRFYGSTSRAPDIFAANSALMGSPRNIAVGQELVIPNP